MVWGFCCLFCFVFRLCRRKALYPYILVHWWGRKVNQVLVLPFWASRLSPPHLAPESLLILVKSSAWYLVKNNTKSCSDLINFFKILLFSVLAITKYLFLMLKVVCVHEGFIIFSVVSFSDVYDFALLNIYSTIFISRLFQKYPVFYYLCLQLKDHRFLELMLVCQLIILAKVGYFLYKWYDSVNQYYNLHAFIWL